MQYKEFVEILREVSESKDLNEGNILKKVQDKLKEKSDENGIDSAYMVAYNGFKSEGFYKNYKFKLQMPDNTIAQGTLLCFAIQCNNKLLVKLLLENEVSVAMKDHSGLTPLHIAVLCGNIEIIQLLLNDKRVNPLSKDAKGQPPRGIVGNVTNKNSIVSMLKKAEESYSPKKAKDLNIRIEGEVSTVYRRKAMGL